MSRVYLSSMIAFFSVISFVQNASAGTDRSVSVAVTGGRLELVNGSAVSANYTVECYDKVTGSVVAGAANQTLAPKATIAYGGGGLCAGGAAPTKVTSEGVLLCPGSVAFTGAAALCNSGQALCTITKLQSMGVTGADFYYGYWISSATNWSTSYDGTKWYDQTLTGGKKNYAPITQSGKSNYRCANGTQGTPPIVFYCSAAYTSGNQSGAACCPTNNGFASCKVTVLGTSPAGAHLQSPQFKGGSAF